MKNPKPNHYGRRIRLAGFSSERPMVIMAAGIMMILSVTGSGIAADAEAVNLAVPAGTMSIINGEFRMTDLPVLIDVSSAQVQSLRFGMDYVVDSRGGAAAAGVTTWSLKLDAVRGPAVDEQEEAVVLASIVEQESTSWTSDGIESGSLDATLLVPADADFVKATLSALNDVSGDKKLFKVGSYVTFVKDATAVFAPDPGPDGTALECDIVPGQDLLTHAFSPKVTTQDWSSDSNAFEVSVAALDEDCSEPCEVDLIQPFCDVIDPATNEPVEPKVRARAYMGPAVPAQPFICTGTHKTVSTGTVGGSVGGGLVLKAEVSASLSMAVLEQYDFACNYAMRAEGVGEDGFFRKVQLHTRNGWSGGSYTPTGPPCEYTGEPGMSSCARDISVVTDSFSGTGIAGPGGGGTPIWRLPTSVTICPATSPPLSLKATNSAYQDIPDLYAVEDFDSWTCQVIGINYG